MLGVKNPRPLTSWGVGPHSISRILPNTVHNSGQILVIPRLKVYKCIPDSYLLSLATSCENMGSNSERVMEKSRNFQIVYVGHTNLCKHRTTDHARGIIMKLWIPQPPHSPIAELLLPLEVVTISSAWKLESAAPSGYQVRCGRHGLSNILKLQGMFLYSIYHQREGKTNLFHMRGGQKVANAN